MGPVTPVQPYLEFVYENGDGIKLIAIVLAFHAECNLRYENCLLAVRFPLWWGWCSCDEPPNRVKVGSRVENSSL